MGAESCEFRHDNGATCSDDADWLVQVGTRTADEQRSCALHLGQTCQLMAANENKPRGETVTLTVRELP